MGEIYKAIICYSYGFKYGDGKYEGIELCAKQISKIITESGHKISEANVRKYKQKAINLICDSPEIASWTESKEKAYEHTHSIGKKDITTLFKEFLSDDDEHIIEGKKLEEDE